MLSGGHGGTVVPAPAGTAGPALTMAMAMVAGAQPLDMTAGGGQPLDMAVPVHDMLASCLAVLVGLLLPATLAALVRRRAAPPPHGWAVPAPVDRPPTPPPIAWGISRS